MKSFVRLSLAGFLTTATAWPCTTMVVTKGASADGSVIVAHSDDSEMADPRVMYVPAKDWPTGSKRPIYPFILGPQRYVGSSRGPGYVFPGLPLTAPLTYIDQVPHTFAYFDGTYAIMNEHQLSIGECTDAAKANVNPGPAQIDISELSRIAVERCKKAREAVVLIGKLAEQLGYYGWGETLIIADTEEAFVFEVSGTPSGKGALWAAKKVPDGTFFVAANEFRIRDLDPKERDSLMATDLAKTLRDLKWWNEDPSKPIDWLVAASPGEYNHPYYSLRRVWRVMDRVNPDLKLSPWVEDGYTRAYPFSIKPKNKLSVADVMSLYRDYYQDTEFDMSKGLSGGPFGDPVRFTGPYDPAQNVPTSGAYGSASTGKDPTLQGAFERPVSIFYCGFAYVCQARGWMPSNIGGVMWLGFDAPLTTVFMPFYAGMTQLPSSVQTGDTSVFDRKSMFWAFNYVSNYLAIKFDYMIKDVQSAQREIEGKAFAMQPAVESAALQLNSIDPKLANEYLTNYCVDNASRVLAKWWALSDTLIQKYADGYVNDPSIGTKIGYPAWWRKDVGFQNGPTSYKKPGNK